MAKVVLRCLGAHEIRARLASISRSGSISRQRVYQLTTGAGFPAPVPTLIQGKIWRAEDVEAWIRAHRSGSAC